MRSCYIIPLRHRYHQTRLSQTATTSPSITIAVLPSALPCRPRPALILPELHPERPNFETSQSLLHTSRCVSFPRRASQTNLSWFFPSPKHHTDSARRRVASSRSSHSYLALSPSRPLSPHLTSFLLLLFFFLLSSSNSYSQTTTQHHLLLHSLALTVGSLISISPRARFLLPTSSTLAHRHHLQPCRFSHSSPPATVSIALPALCKVRPSDFSTSLTSTPLPSDSACTHILDHMANMVSSSSSALSRPHRLNFFPFISQPAR